MELTMKKYLNNYIKRAKIQLAAFIIAITICVSDLIWGWVPKGIGAVLAVLALIIVFNLKLSCKRLYSNPDAPDFVRLLYEPKKKKKRSLL